MRTRTALPACLLAAMCLLTSPAPAVTTYTITDLGSFGGSSNGAADLNDLGQVVGRSATSAEHVHAYLWEDGVLTDLGTLGGETSEASAINERGEVVGSADTASGENHAFLWLPAAAYGLPAGMNDLGVLGGGNASRAEEINDEGQVVGWAYADGWNRRAFLWEAGVMTDLGTLGGLRSEASDINNAGEVVGWAHDSYDTSHAFVYAEGTMTGLGLGHAIGVNDNGLAAGHSGILACVWEDCVQSFLPAGYPSVANDVNDPGQIVGHYDNSGCLWEDGVRYDLNDLIPSGSGWFLGPAHSINNAGLIVGWGENPDGEGRGYLLTPIPEPGTAGLAALGMLALALVKKIRG